MTEPSSADSAAAPTAPALRIVRGTPTDAELAALVAVLAARGSGAEAEPDPTGPPRGWRNRTHGFRGTHRPGPAAWRTAPWLR